MTAGLRAFERGLRSGVVLLDLSLESMPAIISALLDGLQATGRLDPEVREEAEVRVRAREAQASTAIGRGAAVPHGLLPTVGHPLVALARLAKPINIGAPDGRPVSFVFLLLGPEGAAETHLQLLVATAQLISDDNLVADWSMAQREQEMLQALDDFLVRSEVWQRRPPIDRNEADGLVFTGRFGGGLINDIKRRARHYVSDFTDGIHYKTIAATLFLYFACVAPAIAFGGLMYQLTGGEIGAIEMIVGTAVGGVIYALFAGQPLNILAGTGPLLVFTGVLYDLCQSLQLEFLPVYAWVGLWTALFCMVIALTDASALIRYCTRFTDEIFGFLLSIIFIYEAVKDIGAQFSDDSVAAYTALLAMVLAVGTYYIATRLSEFRRSVYLRPQLREFLADFGSVIAIGSMVMVSYWMGRSDLPVLVVTDDLSTTSGRPWLVDIFDIPTWVIWVSTVPALLNTVLVYLCQNITSRLINRPENRVQKGGGYHLDMAVISVLIGVCSLFGIPWLVAATVRSLNHVHALATTEEFVREGQVHEHIVHLRETRVTGTAIHVLIGASVMLFPFLRSLGIEIPMAVLFGLFLYMGFSSLSGNQFWERLKLWLKEPALYPKTHYVRRVPLSTVHWFTAIQLVCLSILWVVKASALALLFPLFIALLVPIRMVLGRFFDDTALQILDSEEEPEEEMLREAGA